MKQRKAPFHYKLYDKLKLKVSLRAMDTIIYAIVGLLVLAILIGIIVQ